MTFRVVAHCPHHVIHRRRDRRKIFPSGPSRSALTEEMFNLRRRLNGKLYGYCLMPNHVHVIFDPGESADNMYPFIKGLASLSGLHTPVLRRRHVPLSVLRGEFEVLSISTDDYFLRCAVYVDRNLIEANLAERLADHTWSSYWSRIGRSTAARLDPHPCFLQLGAAGYRELVENTST